MQLKVDVYMFCKDGELSLRLNACVGPQEPKYDTESHFNGMPGIV